MAPFSRSLSRIYQVYSYYILTPVKDQNPADIDRLIDTLSSVTIDELPLILPLLNRILLDIKTAPEMDTLIHTFLALWTRIASSLHTEQVASILVPSLTELLEESMKVKNYKPLMAVCERTVSGKIFACLGNKEFLKGLLPVLIEPL